MRSALNRGGRKRLEYQRTVGDCTVCGERQPIVSRGWCSGCYQRDWRQRHRGQRYGDAGRRY